MPETPGDLEEFQQAGPVEAVHDARRRGLGLLAILVVLLLSTWFLAWEFDEWLLLAVIALPLIQGSRFLYREFRRPDRLLRPVIDDPALEILRRWNETGPGSGPRSAAPEERLVQARMDLDRLHPGETFLRRHRGTLAKVASVLGVGGSLAAGGATLVTHHDPLGALISLGGAALFGLMGGLVWKGEGRRAEARALLRAEIARARKALSDGEAEP